MTQGFIHKKSRNHTKFQMKSNKKVAWRVIDIEKLKCNFQMKTIHQLHIIATATKDINIVPRIPHNLTAPDLP